MRDDENQNSDMWRPVCRKRGFVGLVRRVRVRAAARALFWCLVTGSLWANLAPACAAAAEPLKIIFDTDIDGDNDDVAAAAILHTLADAGQVEILAMGVISRYAHSPACLDAINTYYGRGEIPIGVYKGSTLAMHGSPHAKV